MKGHGTRAIIIAFVILVATYAWRQFGPIPPDEWTAADLDLLQSLSLVNLAPLPADATNAVADDHRAATFGQKLFFDTRLSANGYISCATCHQPEQRFTDGLRKGRAIGQSMRNTPSIVGTAYSPWLYWDGRKDSQWAQALSPLEDPAEQGSNRVQIVRLIATDSSYRQAYETLFGDLPDVSESNRFPIAAAPLDDPSLRAAWDSMTAADQLAINTAFANVGKAIAAYERLLLPGPSRFDHYIAALTKGETEVANGILTRDEILGLQLFIDEARCTECHNGPLFTNNEFHNTGVLSFNGETPDRGRIDGLKKVLTDPFNCLGPFSDGSEDHCAELSFVRSGIELIGAMRTPSLRNLGGTAPYSHKGQQASLASLLSQYNRAPLAMIGHNEAEIELNLSRRELRQLEEFLNTLDAPLATQNKWLIKP